jgi:hypothetical protein
VLGCSQGPLDSVGRDRRRPALPGAPAGVPVGREADVEARLGLEAPDRFPVGLTLCREVEPVPAPGVENRSPGQVLLRLRHAEGEEDAVVAPDGHLVVGVVGGNKGGAPIAPSLVARFEEGNFGDDDRLVARVVDREGVERPVASRRADPDLELEGSRGDC